MIERRNQDFGGEFYLKYRDWNQKEVQNYCFRHVLVEQIHLHLKIQSPNWNHMVRRHHSNRRRKDWDFASKRHFVECQCISLGSEAYLFL